MNIERGLIIITLILLALMFSMQLGEEEGAKDFFRFVYHVSLVSLIIFFLFQKPGVLVAISLVVVLLTRTGIFNRIDNDISELIVGLGEILGFLFLPVFLVDSFRRTTEAKIFGLLLTLIFILQLISIFMHLTEVARPLYFELAYVLIIFTIFYRQIDYRTDLQRILIVIGIVSLSDILEVIHF